MDDSTDIVGALANIGEFYAHESCGQCTPCREGALWMSKALHRLTHGQGRRADAEYLLHIAQNIQGTHHLRLRRGGLLAGAEFREESSSDEFVARGADRRGPGRGHSGIRRPGRPRTPVGHP
jgi:hypothetical protein